MLNARQEKFCQEYAKTGNATQSAISAGYEERSARTTASRMLTNDDIRNRIAELTAKGQKKAEEKAIMTVAERMKLLTNIALGNETDEVVIYKDGEWVRTNKTAKVADRINALELLDKMESRASGGENSRNALETLIEALKSV